MYNVYKELEWVKDKKTKQKSVWVSFIYYAKLL